MTEGLLVVCLAVTVYALGQKLVPGLHLGRVFTLDQTGVVQRLQEPLGYWNALALLLAMAVPAALSVVVDRARPDPVRLGASAAMVAMLLTIGFTYSRGGVLALLVALALTVTLSGAWLRCLMWLAAVAIAATPVLVLGLASHRLTAADVGLGARERAGGELAVVLGACVTLLVLGGRQLIGRERRATVSPAAVRLVVRGLVAAAVSMTAVAVIAVALSHRGLSGTVSHAWSSFTTTRTTSVDDPSRLLSADSENRWVWWEEAAGAFVDRPLQGWGAGSFAVVHLLYRRNTLSVQQPHSLALQFLAETGVVGAALGLGAFAVLLTAGVRAVRRSSTPSTRVPAAAPLAAAGAYPLHSLYDWDWDIPARALLLASSSRPGSLDSALVQARRSSPLDPLSDAGLLAAATIQIHRGDFTAARQDLISALGREPSDGQAWQELSYTDLALHRDAQWMVATQRALAADPESPAAIAAAASAALSLAAPAGSAAATATPGSVR